MMTTPWGYSRERIKTNVEYTGEGIGNLYRCERETSYAYTKGKVYIIDRVVNGCALCFTGDNGAAHGAAFKDGDPFEGFVYLGNISEKPKRKFKITIEIEEI